MAVYHLKMLLKTMKTKDLRMKCPLVRINEFRHDSSIHSFKSNI